MAKLKYYNNSTSKWEEIKVSTRFKDLLNTVKLTQDQNHVDIGITNYNPVEDVLFTIQNSTWLQKGEDYIINGGLLRIESKDGSNWSNGDTFNFVVLKNVDKDNLPSADGGLIQDGSITIAKLATSLQGYITKIGVTDISAVGVTLSDAINALNMQLSDMANVKSYGAKADGITDDTQAFLNAIDNLKTNEYTESIPTQESKKILIIPAGRYKITTKISIPSYIKIQGYGKHTTILDSYITNGDPIFEIVESSGNQQFYNTLEGFSISGNNNACQGIKIDHTSRWVIKDVMINDTLYEGLYLENSYMGEVYSINIRSCGGDGIHDAIVIENSHAVSFFGGEINGGNNTLNGIAINTTTSVALFGTTIEGFNNGIGIVNNGSNSLLVDGCYFEANKEDIVETSPTLGSNYLHNFLGALAMTGGRGHIGITYAQGCSIEGNYFQDTTSVKIFDATPNSTGKIQAASSIRANYAPTWPISISQSLLDSARTTGALIETYDGAIGIARYGVHLFKDNAIFASELRPNLGITNLNNLNCVVKAGSGSPEGLVTATKGIYFDINGTLGATVYIKTAGTNNLANWKPIQSIHYAYTASRPTLTSNDVGYMIFDRTLNKPIWWNGTVWIDATGTTV